MQHYVIKFVSDLRQVGRWFSPGTPVSSSNKTDRHDITEILLKVALSTINQINLNEPHWKLTKIFRLSSFKDINLQVHVNLEILVYFHTFKYSYF